VPSNITTITLSGDSALAERSNEKSQVPLQAKLCRKFAPNIAEFGVNGLAFLD